MRQIQLNIGGQMRPFHFGLYVLGELIDSTGIDITEIDQYIGKNPIKAIPQLMYHSAAYALERQEKEVTFKVYDVLEWIEDAGGFDSDPVVKFLEAFNKSMTKNAPTEKPVKGEKKRG